MTKVALPTEVIEFGSSSPEHIAGFPLSRESPARRQCAGYHGTLAPHFADGCSTLK
jgi:hypothetical protein